MRRAFLGIGIGELTDKVARELKLRARSGVRVVNVRPDTPAEKAGLQPDDVITNFGEIAVRAPGADRSGRATDGRRPSRLRA